MYTFAQKQAPSAEVTTSSLTRSKSAVSNTNLRERTAVKTQDIAQNHWTPPTLRPGSTSASSGESERKLERGATLGTYQNFAQIPVHTLTVPTLQAKLVINKPGDEYEQEADRVADQVMRIPNRAHASSAASFRMPASEAPALQRQCDCGGTYSDCTTEQSREVPRRLRLKPVNGSGLSQTEAPPVIHEVLRSPGQPLDPATHAFMEPRFGRDFSSVRVHTDTAAEQSSRDVNARAYTAGHNIVFGSGQYAPGTATGDRLLAHELAHVVQQGFGATAIQRSPAVAAPSAVKPDPGLEITAAASPLDEIVQELSYPDSKNLNDPSWQGLKHINEILYTLPFAEALKTIEELRSRGLLDRLIERAIGYPRFFDSDRAVAALYVVRWTGEDNGKEQPSELEAAATAITNLSAENKKLALNYLKSHTSPEKAEMIIDGLAAIQEAQAAQPTVYDVEKDRKGPPEESVTPSGMGAGSYASPPPIEPGPVNRPGKQWWGYYIGNEAHTGITEIYEEEHLGDLTFYNFRPISSIIGGAADLLTKEEQGLKPDITNLTEHHLYEIKSWRRLGEAIAESEMYIELFNRAGVQMSAGPTTEPGTSGALPAPAGVFMFSSLVPGTIVYRYFPRQSLQPVREETSEGIRWRYEPTPVQKAIIATTAVGIGAIILMALFALVVA